MKTLVQSIKMAMADLKESVHGTKALTVDLDSPLDKTMRKTGNPFIGQGLVKRVTLNGMVGYSYGNSVNRMADKEGKEERDTKQHPWGDMDEKRLFRIHRKTGEAYLSMRVTQSVTHGYFIDGEEVSADDVKPFLPEKRKSSTQADLEGEVIARDFKMENIMAIRFDGKEVRLQ